MLLTEEERISCTVKWNCSSHLLQCVYLISFWASLLITVSVSPLRLSIFCMYGLICFDSNNLIT